MHFICLMAISLLTYSNLTEMVTPSSTFIRLIKPCNNAGKKDDLFAEQFVQSLKGIAFNWYTNLTFGSLIAGSKWKLSSYLFYSMHPIANVAELTSSGQQNDESIIDYINCWRVLSLKCKDHLFESSDVEMRAKGMDWDILFALRVNTPKTFQELTTQAHDIELITAYLGNGLTMMDQCYRHEIEAPSLKVLNTRKALILSLMC